MKRLMLLLMLLGISGSLFGQTTTTTAHKIGDFWYFNSFTQPLPQLQTYQPFQVPLVDSFQPFRQDLYNLGQTLRWKAEQEQRERAIRAQSQLAAQQLQLQSKQRQEQSAELQFKNWLNSLDQDCGKKMFNDEFMQKLFKENAVKFYEVIDTVCKK